MPRALLSFVLSAAAACAADVYVNARLCGNCHAEIAEAYRHTGMARSVFRLEPRNIVEDFSEGGTFHHKASDRYYKVFQRDGKHYQRRHQIGLDGHETNVVEKQIDYVLGSGNHARSYLHRTPSGKLVQLPLFSGGVGIKSPSGVGSREDLGTATQTTI